MVFPEIPIMNWCRPTFAMFSRESSPSWPSSPATTSLMAPLSQGRAKTSQEAKKKKMLHPTSTRKADMGFKSSKPRLYMSTFPD